MEKYWFWAYGIWNITLLNLKSSIQQNSFSISLPLDTMTTWWLVSACSDRVVTVINCKQHSDYTVTVQSLCLVGDWWNRSLAMYAYVHKYMTTWIYGGVLKLLWKLFSWFKGGYKRSFLDIKVLFVLGKLPK